MILVDTSVLIDFFKGDINENTEKLKTIILQNIPFGINSFIFQEVLQGASTKEDFELLRDYLKTQKFYHLKDPVSSFIQAAEIYFNCRKQGINVRSTIDCLNVQTTLEHDLFLLHNNKVFFEIARVIPIKFF